jgi:hypothetical protein
MPARAEMKMRSDDSAPECNLRVDWAKLNNELFALIYADPDLLQRYDRADSAEAQEICSEQFDLLADNAADFLERFIIKN